MDLLELLDHLLNLVLPGVGTGMIAAAFTKLLWRRELTSVSYLRLASWAGASSAGVAMAGLVIFGRDGRMQTYLAMWVACAAALAWVGWGRRAAMSAMR